MSFKKGLFKNLLVFGGYNYLSQAIAFFSTIITSRLLMPESFGFVGLITVFTGFITIFSDSGISLAVIKSDYKNTYQKAVDNLALALGLSLCLITCLMAYPIAVFYNNLELVWPTMVMSLIFIFKSISIVRGAILAKALNFGMIGKVKLITTIMQVAMTVLMAWYGADYWALIIPQIAASILMYIIYERYIKLGFKIYPVAYIKSAYRLTKRTVGNLMGFHLVNYWARNSDNLLVGKLYGSADLGIYSRAYSLLLTPLSLITGLISSVLYPTMEKLKNTPEKINEEYFFILKMIMYITFPITCILVTIPHAMVSFLWGPEWIKVADLLPYFGLLIFSQSLLSTTGNILVLVGKENIMRITGWTGAVATIGGICFGAMFSVQAVAECYTLAFLVFVLPYNLYAVFITALKFEVTGILLFWLPIIFLSILIWVFCYFHLNYLTYISLAALFIFMLVTSVGEMKKIYKQFQVKGFALK